MTDKDRVIDRLLENSNHGTQRRDIVAAYEAGAAQVADLREEVDLDNKRIAELERVLKAIPACPDHGELCIPHAMAWVAKASAVVASHPHGGMQAGLDNDKLREAWDRKLPGVEPTDRQMTAFALGVEVGFEHARNLERQDWSRVHHVLAKAGVHPGRTDDHLADVIDRALRSRA